MQERLMHFLCCPECQGSLTVSVENYEKHHGGNDITAGVLRCACGRHYRIQEAIPWFSPTDHAQKKTQERFAFQWLRYPKREFHDREIFLNETQIPIPEWKGKSVLDAGCGMGRYTKIAHDMGAEVIAFDLSEALVRLLPLARTSPRLHLVQGDILKPPFPKKSFDIIYSLGVIHHTPNTERAFQSLDSLVRPGGLLSVWVYGTAGCWKGFKTNPLRPGRKWLGGILPLIWGIVWVRERWSACLRTITTRLPHRLLYFFCYPLAYLGALPLFQYLTFSVHPAWRVRLQENFDWLAPPFQFHHTKEEVLGWFRNAGYTELSQLAHGVVPKVGIKGIKPPC